MKVLKVVVVAAVLLVVAVAAAVLVGRQQLAAAQAVAARVDPAPGWQQTFRDDTPGPDVLCVGTSPCPSVSISWRTTEVTARDVETALGRLDAGLAARAAQQCPAQEYCEVSARVDGHDVLFRRNPSDDRIGLSLQVSG